MRGRRINTKPPQHTKQANTAGNSLPRSPRANSTNIENRPPTDQLLNEPMNNDITINSVSSSSTLATADQMIHVQTNIPNSVNIMANIMTSPTDKRSDAKSANSLPLDLSVTTPATRPATHPDKPPGNPPDGDPDEPPPGHLPRDSQ